MLVNILSQLITYYISPHFQFTQKKIAGSIVTGTRRMKRMLQMTTDEIATYGNDSDEWNSKIVEFDQVNEVMDDLANGRNTNNWRYVLKW